MEPEESITHIKEYMQSLKTSSGVILDKEVYYALERAIQDIQILQSIKDEFSDSYPVAPSAFMYSVKEILGDGYILHSNEGIKCPTDLNRYILEFPFENTFPSGECETRRFYGDCYHCFGSAIAKRDRQIKEHCKQILDDGDDDCSHCKKSAECVATITEAYNRLKDQNDSLVEADAVVDVLNKARKVIWDTSLTDPCKIIELRKLIDYTDNTSAVIGGNISDENNN